MWQDVYGEIYNILLFYLFIVWEEKLQNVALLLDPEVMKSKKMENEVQQVEQIKIETDCCTHRQELYEKYGEFYSSPCSMEELDEEEASTAKAENPFK